MPGGPPQRPSPPRSARLPRPALPRRVLPRLALPRPVLPRPVLPRLALPRLALPRLDPARLVPARLCLPAVRSAAAGSACVGTAPAWYRPGWNHAGRPGLLFGFGWRRFPRFRLGRLRLRELRPVPPGLRRFVRKPLVNPRRRNHPPSITRDARHGRLRHAGALTRRRTTKITRCALPEYFPRFLKRHIGFKTTHRAQSRPGCPPGQLAAPIRLRRRPGSDPRGQYPGRRAVDGILGSDECAVRRRLRAERGQGLRVRSARRAHGRARPRRRRERQGRLASRL